ncbi:MAG TPA: excinuclease ABC subunit UvrA, partial [Candidatus Lokiarchaeia archaeon]|nr:excinuclease ABC subunit UvrA [Candidatus Lokiarchaeia archaeon]
SGKSSLAFDLIFEVGRTRYLQAIGVPARDVEEKHFDLVEGLAPTIAVEQRTLRLANPRSTVGTKTQIYNVLRMLYASEAQILCPICKDPVPRPSLECPTCGMAAESMEIKNFSFNEKSGMCLTCQGRGSIMEFRESYIVSDPSRNIVQICAAASGSFADLKTWLPGLAEYFEFDVKTPWADLPDKAKHAFLSGMEEEIAHQYESKRFQGQINKRFEGVIPHLKRAMETSKSEYRKNKIAKNYMSNAPCPDCHGFRVNDRAREARLGGLHIGEAANLTMGELQTFLERLLHEWKDDHGSPLGHGKALVGAILPLIGHMQDVGLGYLALNREIPSLSGGEKQRLLLASHLGAELDSLIYVLDEPTMGLHEVEKEALAKALVGLRDLGNSVLLVEHDRHLIEKADQIIDIGPGAGTEGGELVFQGTLDELRACPSSITGQYLAGTLKIPHKIASERRVVSAETPRLVVKNASANNLKNITVAFPTGVLIGIAGVSGSGKSSLIIDSLVPLLKQRIAQERVARKKTKNGKKKSTKEVVEEEEDDFEYSATAQLSGDLEGWDLFSRCYVAGQGPIGRTRKSNPASYTGVWDKIRNLFAEQPEARKRRYTASHFSFNSESGRCPACNGDGTESVKIAFLEDLDVPCPECHGTRYLPEVLEVTYRGKNISDVLNLTVTEALELFVAEEGIMQILGLLAEIGMGYITLGQPATTLSGGEGQRIKLARELSKAREGDALFVLDEPSTGLHFHDVGKLLHLLDRLAGQGNTVVVIEHDLDILAFMDWIIELGPEGGPYGGEIIAEGTPEDIAASAASKTGSYIAQNLTEV